MRSSAVFSAVALASFAVVTAAPIPLPEAFEGEIVERQDNITSPLITVNLGDLGELQPIPEALFEQDSDAGGETGDGGTAVATASSYLTGAGGVGTSTQSNGTSTGTSSFCSTFFSCCNTEANTNMTQA